jgi:hypothetical protein
MRKILLLLALSFVVSFAFAQSPIANGGSQLNVGAGFSSNGVPVYIGMDYGVSNDVTMGAEFSYKSYTEKYNHREYKHTIYGFSGNANYHFNRIMNIPRDWDFYAGLNVGFYVWTSPDNYPGSKSSGLGLGAQIGGRYYFTDAVGVNLEFGGGNAFSGGKIGVTVKL